MNGRCGLHQIPSTFGHLVDRRTSRRAVTHTAGRSALPAWALLREHIAVRRRRARYRLQRSVKPRAARHGIARRRWARLRTVARAARSFSSDAPAAARSFVVQAGRRLCEPGGGEQANTTVAYRR